MISYTREHLSMLPEEKSPDKLPVVKLSSSELDALNADPFSDEASEFMARSGVEFGQPLVIHNTDTDELSVVETRPEDFLTRDREATETYRVEHGGEVDRLALEDRFGEGVTIVTVEVPEIGDNHPERVPSRIEKLFAPIVRPEAPAYDNDYSYLFASHEEYDIEMEKRRLRHEASQPVLRAQREHDTFVNDESRQDAVDRLFRSTGNDDELADILERHGIKTPSLEAVDQIRTNASLRLEVAEYLLGKLKKQIVEEPLMFGDRLYINGQKRTDAKTMPVDYITSQEYATYLALAMIDGSFKKERVQKGDSSGGTGSNIQTGQHRDAAEKLLGLKE